MAIKNDTLHKAIQLTTEFSFIKRRCGYKTRHWENDAEHSYQLAVVAWALNHEYKLNYNEEKILKLSLIHDLVEIYAGDTESHRKKGQDDKKEREEKALKSLKRNFPSLSFLFEEIEDYESKSSNEAKLVNISDKIIPIRHVYNRQWDYYKKRKVTIDGWIEWCYQKTDYENLHGELRKIVNDTIDEVKSKYEELFYKVK